MSVYFDLLSHGSIIVLLPTLLLPTHALKQRQEEKFRVAKKLESERDGLEIGQKDLERSDSQEDAKLHLPRYICATLSGFLGFLI